MSISKKLERFLDRHKVNYEIVSHPAAFTSCETAEAEHVSGREIAKIVMVKAGGRDVMTVIPGHCTLDLLKLSALLGAADLRIEEQKEFEELFGDCEAGAMPPFGKLYGLPCYADRSLENGEFVYFNAGNHRESVRLAIEDFLRISKAEIGDFAVEGKKIREPKWAR